MATNHAGFPRSTPLSAALEYRGRGLSAFPVHHKRPLIAWAELQQRLPTEDEIRGWWMQWPDAGVAVATGRGALVVDLDGSGAMDLLAAAGVIIPDVAPLSRTARGYHAWFATEKVARNRTALLAGPTGKPQVDIRGDGGYVVAPPSMHESGIRYEWVRRGQWPPPPIPDALGRLLDAEDEHQSGRESGWLATVLAGSTQGSRNSDCAALAGYLLAHHAPDIVVMLLVHWGRSCDPPLSAREVETTVRSVHRTRVRGRYSLGLSKDGRAGHRIRIQFNALSARLANLTREVTWMERQGASGTLPRVEGITLPALREALENTRQQLGELLTLPGLLSRPSFFARCANEGVQLSVHERNAHLYRAENPDGETDVLEWLFGAAVTAGAAA